PPPPPPPPPAANRTLDLQGFAPAAGFLRASGSGAAGDGRFGLPVAGGHDADLDGHRDYARANMLASPLGRARAGGVQLIFGDGRIAGNVDLAVPNNRVLNIVGDGAQEATGGEIWMADVTGDGAGDLIIGRPNFRAAAPDRIGAGALTIIVGGPALRTLATNGATLDLRAPPPSVRIVTLVGAATLDRLGFWMRTGDITGDGVDDIAVGADQEDTGGAVNSGAVYVIRGGPHLDANLTVDLAGFGATALDGRIFRVLPPPGSADYHFGATVALADLDGNRRAELIASASLNRAGGVLLAEGAPPGSAVGSGGNPGGSVFILWDDNLPAGALWPANLTFTMGALPISQTRIDGGSVAGQYTNDRFGEEILGGLDYNGDAAPDVFFGDITGQATGRDAAGVGHVFFTAARLKNRSFTMSAPPVDIALTTIFGPSAGAIFSDTAAHGDFDNDGIDDLAVSSPTASPFGRVSAGIMHVIWGRSGNWPAVVDLLDARKPSPALLRITDIFGARGDVSASDRGDTLMYSAASADMDRDGRDDLIVNEMRGNGVSPAATDVGNLLVIGGAAIPKQ
ncbi:MAG TPA: hypothetical protein DDZ68_02440, partial [Parvularcula sp.]|nr:hypothetical protein [Parvularcula sp.]